LVQQINSSLVHLSSVLLAAVRTAPQTLLGASWDQEVSRSAAQDEENMHLLEADLFSRAHFFTPRLTTLQGSRVKSTGLHAAPTASTACSLDFFLHLEEHLMEHFVEMCFPLRKEKILHIPHRCRNLSLKSDNLKACF